MNNYLLTQDNEADVRDATQMTPSSRMQNPSSNQFSSSSIAIFVTFSRFRRRPKQTAAQSATQPNNQLHIYKQSATQANSQLLGQAASDSTLKLLTTCGYQILVLYFFYFYKQPAVNLLVFVPRDSNLLSLDFYARH